MIHLEASAGQLEDALGENVGTMWAGGNHPVAAADASFVQAAPGAGVFNVVRSLSVVLANAGAAVSGLITVNLKDGVTVKESWRFLVPAGDTRGIALADIYVPGSDNASMTLETSGVGANVTADVNMSGFVTNAF